MFHKPIATAVIAALLMTGTLSPGSPASGQGAQLPESTVAAATPMTEAEAIALDHAGVTADQVTGLRTHRDHDDRTPTYEIEFRVGRTEYEYEIHAGTGRILDFDRDN